MRDLTTILAGALGGALLAVIIVFAAAGNGILPGTGPISGEAIHAYLLNNPGILAEVSERHQAQEEAAQNKTAAEALKKIGLNAFFDPKIAFVTGPADAARSVVEIYDFNCPYCRASAPALEKYYRAHKNDTRFSFIEFPIKGPDSVLAARVALAARNQPDKYLALHFALMNESSQVNADILYAMAQKIGLDMEKLRADMDKPAITAAIAASRDLAKKAGIDGTPTFIINGVMHPGAVDEPTLNALVKEG